PWCSRAGKRSDRPRGRSCRFHRLVKGVIGGLMVCRSGRARTTTVIYTRVVHPTIAAMENAPRGGNTVMARHPDLATAHLRIARLSADLLAAVKFYRDGLGFDVLYEFKDHDGFDAVMLGRHGAPYHLAFVHKAGHQVPPASTHDDLLVFYLPDADDWSGAVSRLKALGHQPVKAFNPYW